MHAFLVTGGTKETRLKEIAAMSKSWHITSVDTVSVSLEGTSIGIAEIRTLENRLSLKPYQSPFTLAVIEDAHTLTLEAQQSLLKTLEEPPGHCRIIMETDNAHTLLPTILSRVHLKQLPEETRFPAETLSQCFKILIEAGLATPGEKLKLSAAIAKTKPEALSWIEAAITTLEIKLRSAQTESSQPAAAKMLSRNQTAQVLRLLLVSRQQLLANVHPTLVLDTLFLSLPPQK